MKWSLYAILHPQTGNSCPKSCSGKVQTVYFTVLFTEFMCVWRVHKNMFHHTEDQRFVGRIISNQEVVTSSPCFTLFTGKTPVPPLIVKSCCHLHPYRVFIISRWRWTCLSTSSSFTKAMPWNHYVELQLWSTNRITILFTSETWVLYDEVKGPPQPELIYLEKQLFFSCPIFILQPSTRGKQRCFTVSVI